jgi:D-3-phosphoglycerate dehydrogenase
MILGVTAKSFLKNKQLCRELAEACPEAEIRWASGDHELDTAGLKQLLRPCTHWIVGREPVRAELLQALPKLQVISKYGVGLDNVDQKACREAGVDLRFRPGVNARAVAEITFGMMISLCRNISICSRRLAAGHWWKNGGQSLYGRTVGIIGCGAIGYRVAKLASDFGCHVLVCDLLDKRNILVRLNASQVDLNSLLRQSDLVSLHVPLTDETREMINAQTLSLMAETAFLINTSRGEVVDQRSLKIALQNRELAGAALDVFVDEPDVDKDLVSLENVLATPHIAGNSREAVAGMGQAAIDGVKSKGTCQLGC